MTKNSPDSESGYWFDSTTSLFPLTEALTDVQAGQVWRARWDDVVSLVFVDDADTARANFVRVAPVTIGADDADDTAVIVDRGRARFATALTVWPELVHDVAEVVLERLLTTFEYQFATLAELEAAAVRHELVYGLPILNERSPRLEAKRRLAAAMDVFATAIQVGGGDGSLEAVLAGLTVSTVANALAATPKDALKVLRGEVPISEQQAHCLAVVSGRTAAELLRANPRPPESLVEAVAPLRRGQQIRAIAEYSKRLESEILEDIIRSAFTLAARGDRGHQDWPGRVDKYLQSAAAGAR